jgi:hypothetical protein
MTRTGVRTSVAYTMRRVDRGGLSPEAWSVTVVIARLPQILLMAPILAGVLLTACQGSSDTGPLASVSPAGPTPAAPPPATIVLTATPTIAAPTVTPALPATAPACAKDGYTVSAAAQAAAGSVAISILLQSRGAPCTVSEPIVATVYDRGGVPLLGVASNPASFPSGFVTGAEGVTRVVTWSNWCAAPGTFSATVSLGGAPVLVPIAGPPRCDAPSQKSALALRP